MLDKCPYCGKLTDWTKYRCMHCRWTLHKKVNK